ncbi:MAG TPA: AAA family ATPase, partial [Gallicola sp.]|nr:AAA family ATPase [Gallicola sp.]
MKINKVSLFNIGAYAELNVFEINNNDNNIILIGGKNGAGKSTFFKAIKTCLYGCKIWGFEANCRQYFDIINKLINNDAKLKNEATGYIEIDILFEDGKNDDVYTIKREWIKKKKSISENHIVFKNGVILLNAEKNDFDNYLLSIIPPEMFKFYFFDGEELSDFFLGSKGAQNFRDAFLKLYGLDTITIMLENFRRNVNGGKDKSIYEEYNNSKAEYLEQKKEKSQLLKKIDKLEEDIDNLNSKQKSIIDDFKRFGGISLDTWNSLNKKLDYEDLVRTENAKKIKEIANNFIPFLILHNELIELENKIEQYIIHNKMQIFKEIVKEDKFINYLKQNKISEIEIIQNYVKNSTNAGNIFDFSSSEYKKINYQLNEKLRFDKQELFNLLDDTERSLNETKKIRNILNNSSIDGIQTITNEINKLEIVKLGKEKKVLELKNKVDKVNLILEDKNKHYLKNKDNIKTALKKESVSDISETALIAFELLEEKLIKRQSEILAKEFIAIFNKIINKKNFIDGIAVDYNINVIPYKIIYLNKEKLQNYISDEYN